jgi:hypothetical protein
VHGHIALVTEQDLVALVHGATQADLTYDMVLRTTINVVSTAVKSDSPQTQILTSSSSTSFPSELASPFSIASEFPFILDVCRNYTSHKKACSYGSGTAIPGADLVGSEG